MVVVLQDVTKSYFGQVPVLSQVSLALERGDFLYLIGGTGTGKTTLLRMLATEEPPNQGIVSLFGYDLSRISPATLRAIRRSIGYVPQDVRLVPDLSVYDNIALSLSLAGQRTMGRDVRGRIDEIVETLGLTPKREQLAAHLSGGEAQRVAVARCLVRMPELIVADEPTGAQDRDSTWNLMDLLVRGNRSGATVVVATHDREIVRRVPRPCAVLKNGHVLVEGQSNTCLF